MRVAVANGHVSFGSAPGISAPSTQTGRDASDPGVMNMMQPDHSANAARISWSIYAGARQVVLARP